MKVLRSWDKLTAYVDLQQERGVEDQGKRGCGERKKILLVPWKQGRLWELTSFGQVLDAKKRIRWRFNLFLLARLYWRDRIDFLALERDRPDANMSCQRESKARNVSVLYLFQISKSCFVNAVLFWHSASRLKCRKASREENGKSVLWCTLAFQFGPGFSTRLVIFWSGVSNWSPA